MPKQSLKKILENLTEDDLISIDWVDSGYEADAGWVDKDEDVPDKDMVVKGTVGFIYKIDKTKIYMKKNMDIKGDALGRFLIAIKNILKIEKAPTEGWEVLYEKGKRCKKEK